MTNSGNFAEKLRSLRDKYHLSQEELAAELEVDRSYLSQIENGRKEPGRKLIERIRVVESEGIHRSNVKKSQEALRMIPLVGWAQAMDAVNLIDFGDVPEWDDFVSSDIRDPKAIAVRIRGDSMEPVYREGDIAILACSEPPHSGNLIVGRLKSEGAIFKLFQVLSVDPPKYRLESLNSHYEPIVRTAEDFIWIYPVHSVIKKLM